MSLTKQEVLMMLFTTTSSTRWNSSGKIERCPPVGWNPPKPHHSDWKPPKPLHSDWKPPKPLRSDWDQMMDEMEQMKEDMMNMDIDLIW
jgi:hypothetical protein